MGASRPLPSHTTVRTGPYTAVRWLTSSSCSVTEALPECRRTSPTAPLELRDVEPSPRAPGTRPRLPRLGPGEPQGLRTKIPRVFWLSPRWISYIITLNYFLDYV